MIPRAVRWAVAGGRSEPRAARSESASSPAVATPPCTSTTSSSSVRTAVIAGSLTALARSLPTSWLTRARVIDASAAMAVCVGHPSASAPWRPRTNSSTRRAPSPAAFAPAATPGAPRGPLPRSRSARASIESVAGSTGGSSTVVSVPGSVVRGFCVDGGDSGSGRSVPGGRSRSRRRRKAAVISRRVLAPTPRIRSNRARLEARRSRTVRMLARSRALVARVPRPRAGIGVWRVAGARIRASSSSLSTSAVIGVARRLAKQAFHSASICSALSKRRAMSRRKARVKKRASGSRRSVSKRSASTVASTSMSDGSLRPSPHFGRLPVAISWSVAATA